MSRIRYQAKANGLTVLKGNWLKAGLILLLIGLLLLGFSALGEAFRTAFGVPLYNADGLLNTSPASFAIEGAFALLVLLFVPPLVTGQAEWYWSLTGEKPGSIGEVFGWFGSLRLYLKSFGLALNLFFRGLLWAVLTCGLPLAMLFAGYTWFLPSDFSVFSLKIIWFVLLAGFGYVLLLGGLFLLLYILTRYFLAVFLLVENSGCRIRDAVRLSRAYTKGRRWQITAFVLSFILWFVTCYFVLPAFYVVPYFSSSSAVYARHLIYSGRARMKKSEVTAA